MIPIHGPDCRRHSEASGSDYADQSHMMYEWAESMLGKARAVPSLIEEALGESCGSVRPGHFLTRRFSRRSPWR